VNRITAGATIPSCGANCWGLTFGYDQWANLTMATATGSATPLNLTVNGNNQITTTGFTYDGSGNLTADVTSAYAWNAESEIKTATGVNYTYDGDGNRVQKSNGKIYWYGAGTEILDESDASGNITNEYVFFGGKRVALRTVSSGTITYYAEDFLGSTRVMTTSVGAVCYDADFYPYGGEKVFTNTCAQNYKFEGKERDAETGNDAFGARYYSSVYGRWLSPDWSAVPAPVPYADLTNPQTLNLYAMVRDNPETFADLDGHGADTLGGATWPMSDVFRMMARQVVTTNKNDQQKKQKEQKDKKDSAKDKKDPTAPPAPATPKPPANALQKTEFPTTDAAGIQAEQRYNPTSITKNIEYAGWIEKNGNGTYSIDSAKTLGLDWGSDPGPRPVNAAGEYHTHAGPSEGAEKFSEGKGQDLDFGRKEGVPMYLGTPSGRILKFDPAANRKSVLPARTATEEQ
jgi:RHS repeat-associated protein